MDSNKKNQNAGTGKEDKDLPGYPHYPSQDDIMNPQSGFTKISADEEIANSKNISSRSVKNSSDADDSNQADSDDDLGIVAGTDADVTAEDLLILGDPDGDADEGDDEQTGTARVDDVEGDLDEDLDIPGAELDDKEENIGEEDEENNYYSLGGDRHESLEEDSSNVNE